MKLLDKNKYSDHNKAYQQIAKLKDKVNGQVIKIGLDYVMKISGTLKNDEFFNLRNSLTLRLESVFFHSRGCFLPCKKTMRQTLDMVEAMESGDMERAMKIGREMGFKDE